MICDDFWFNLHEDGNYSHKFVLTTKKPDVFI